MVDVFAEIPSQSEPVMTDPPFDNDFENDKFVDQPFQENKDVDIFEDDTALRKYESERKKLLETRKIKSLEDKKSRQSNAKEEITKFYEQRKQLIQKNVQKNREEEKTTESDNSTASTWEKVGKLSGDLKGKSDNSKVDVSRMRSLLLQLKQDA